MLKFFQKLSFFVIIAVIILYFSFDWILKKGLEYAGSEAAGVQVFIRDADISFFHDNIRLEGIIIENPQGFESNYALEIKNINIKIFFSTFFSQRIIFDQIIIENPYITYEKNGEQASNIKTILNNIKIFSERFKYHPSHKSSQNVLIYDFIVQKGQVNLKSKLIKSRGISTTLPDIHIKDIGRDKNGKTIYEVINILIKSIDGNIIDAVKEPIESLKLKNLKIFNDLKGFSDKL
ncbi:Uncharacterized protein dnl_26800 [Desulfonema limicola]|uniref:AsmA domain-containing protein n=1 Tax=Desulfonema limicola TaxID=45656 RepID=A0A975B7Z4_9BACT|nr:hypothetical protein [Desulfonema limicola]QTA80378.1 Uncharacterized protein dnl_26800 [Desulfonema limicola]